MKNTKQNKSLDFSDLVFRKLKSYISVISGFFSVISNVVRNLLKIKTTKSVISSLSRNLFKLILLLLKGINIILDSRFHGNDIFNIRSITFHSLRSRGQKNILKTKDYQLKTANNSKSLSFYVSNKLNSNKLTNSLKTKDYNLKTNFGFTLVELIVVITILAILGTIAFVSFGSYSSSSRDSARVADINSLKKSFELYNTIGGAGYPMPDSYTGITYSGGVIWHQGTFGDTAFRVVNKNLSKKIVDPLNGKEYTYSLTANKKEYQLKADFENKLSYFPLDNKLTEKVSADSTGSVCYINGSYNGVITKVSTGSEDYIIAIPSLILTDTTNSSNTTFTGGSLSKMGSGILQCNGTNSPCNITYNAQVVWSGTLSKDNYGTLLNNIQKSYSGSNITTLPTIQNILTTTGTTAIENVVGGLVKSVGSSLSTEEVPLVPVDGECGSDNGLSLSSVPSNLCSKGSSTNPIISGSGWIWNCNGINGSTVNVSCSAKDNKLALYYDMETLNGTLLKDLSGNGNDGKCYNSTTLVSCINGINGPQKTAGYGLTGSGMYFDGIDDRIQSNSTIYMMGHSEYITISALTKKIFYISQPRDIDRSLFGSLRFSNIPGIDSYDYGAPEDRVQYFKNYPSYNQDKWYYINIVLKKDGMYKIYINGELFDSQNYNRSVRYSWGVKLYDIMRRRNYTYGTFYTEGYIDELKITERELTSQEILDYYNATK